MGIGSQEFLIITLLVLAVYLFYRGVMKSKIDDSSVIIGQEDKGKSSKKVRWVDVSGAKTNTSTGLLPSQKYAVVQLLACIQGASPLSAFGDEANNISERIFSSMGLSKQDVGIFLEEQMNSTISGNPEQQFQNMLSALKSIKDKTFLNNLYQKCMRIAEISEDAETISMTKTIFNHELGIY